jgi:hypothetical protein
MKSWQKTHIFSNTAQLTIVILQNHDKTKDFLQILYAVENGHKVYRRLFIPGS